MAAFVSMTHMNREITILFQGDSITDSTRNREKGTHKLGLGSGFVNLIGSQLMYDDPNITICMQDGRRMR